MADRSTPGPGGSPYGSLDDDEQYFRPAGPNSGSGSTGDTTFAATPEFGGTSEFGTPEFGGTPGFGGAPEFATTPPEPRRDEVGTEAIGYGATRTYSGPQKPGRRSGRKQLVLIGSAVALAFVVIGGGAAFVLQGNSGPSGGKPPKAPGAGQPSASPQPTDPRALAKNIQSRKTDPRPLTLTEIFRQTKFSEAGKSYVMTKRRTDKKCASAVTGAKLEGALRKARCTQLLRATFASGGGKLVGTIGIANLSTENAARIAARAAGGGRNYVEPLRGSGNTKTLGRGGSNAVGTADVRGHYLILSWVQYPNGEKIAQKHYPAISNFERNVIVGSSLGTALGHRMITGKPYGNS